MPDLHVWSGVKETAYRLQTGVFHFHHLYLVKCLLQELNFFFFFFSGRGWLLLTLVFHPGSIAEMLRSSEISMFRVNILSHQTGHWPSHREKKDTREESSDSDLVLQLLIYPRCQDLLPVQWSKFRFRFYHCNSSQTRQRWHCTVVLWLQHVDWAILEAKETGLWVTDFGHACNMYASSRSALTAQVRC